MSQLIRSLMKFVALTLIFTVIVDGVLHGSYVESEEFSMSPFRGATMSGGGSGIILFRDGDEAVVLTVAHGYDLTSMDAQESMDRKLQNDGGLRLATGEINGLATSAGGEQIIEENLGLFRHFTFWDPETCPAMNDGVTPPHTGKLNDPYACNGLGPDIDVALQRVRLTAAARTLSFPEIEIGLDPLSPGEALTLVGFGRKFPCDWPGMTEKERKWNEDTGDALKIAKSRIRAVFHGEMFTEGQSTTADARKFGCPKKQATASCGKIMGALPKDEDFGTRWGSGCAGDSGGAWLVQAKGGGFAAVGVNRAAAKRKKKDGSWDMTDDTTYRDGLCKAGGFDACQSTGSAVATLYPVRARIKKTLKAWNPKWASKATYKCEPPKSDGCCGTGCHLCHDGDTSFDCYPKSYQCSSVGSLGSGASITCGDRLGKNTVPKRKCSGSDPQHATSCRALTQGQGWRQKQQCRAVAKDGVCPGLTICCAPGSCSTRSSSPSTCAPFKSCKNFGNKDKCDKGLGGVCKWTPKKYVQPKCVVKPTAKYKCARFSKKNKCKTKVKAADYCKWKGGKCLHKCVAASDGTANSCALVKKGAAELCNYTPKTLVPGTGCIPK